MVVPSRAGCSGGVCRGGEESSTSGIATVGRVHIWVGSRSRIPAAPGYVVQRYACWSAVDPDESLIIVGEVSVAVYIHRHKFDSGAGVEHVDTQGAAGQ